MNNWSERLRRIGATCTWGVVAAFATGVLLAVLNIRGSEYCGGIQLANMPLQRAWTVENANTIVGAWQRGGCTCRAANQVWLDYPFILAYASFLFFIGLRSEHEAERRGMSSLARAAHLSAWGALLAGLFDCLENVGLLVMILKGPASLIPALTSLCAYVKGTLIVISAVVGLVVLAAVIIHWWKGRPVNVRYLETG